MKCLSKYPIHQSPFFKLTTKAKLAALLKMELSELLKLISNDNYRVWTDNGREIQAPKFHLMKAHDRIKEILTRIVSPEWLMSGKRGRSYIDNAKMHQNSDYILNIDITGFYKNTTIERVIQLFIHDFQMNHDVAYLLANLVTWNGIVPTGSPVSQLLAYMANAKTFNRIHEIAVERGLKFSVYVDDLSFSSMMYIPGVLPFLANQELKKVGLEIKKRKTKFFHKNDFKMVTGVGISRDKKLAVPNSKRKKILDKFDAKTSENAEFIQRSIRGSLVSARQIEEDFMSVTYTAIRRSTP